MMEKIIADYPVDKKLEIIKRLSRSSGKNVLDQLIILIDDEDERVRELAGWAVANIQLTSKTDYRQSLGQKVTNLLKDKNWYIRCNAAIVCGKIEFVDSIDTLIQILDDQEIEVREAAANAITRMKRQISQEQIQKIEKLLKKEGKIRHGAMLVIIGVKGQRAKSTILPCLKDKEAFVREEAVRLIGSDKKFTKILIEMARDSYSAVRENAINNLVGIGTSQVVPSLIDATKDVYWVTQINAIEGLGKIGDVRAISMLSRIASREETDDLDDTSNYVIQAARKAIVQIQKKSEIKKKNQE